MLATMMIPFPVTMVSLFTIFRWLGDHTAVQWLGTFKPLWVPAWFGSAFNIFLLRQFFLTIPNDLSEAARIDGCSEVGIFVRVILPLARPALVVVSLFAFMGAWNDFLGPLIYLQRPEQFTLALGLANFQSQHGGTPWHHLMAASVLVVAPIIVLFFLAQRTFIEGIATTGMKG
jgi:multiple sugar transport system permease protein